MMSLSSTVLIYWIYEIMDNEDRYKKALKKIGDMNFNTGRADLLGLRIKEIVREAIHPYKPCPQCKGVGKVPQIRIPDCGDCVNFSSTGPWSGVCSKNHKINDDTDSICSTDFENRLPMQTCHSCGGEKFTKIILEEIDDRFDILDL